MVDLIVAAELAVAIILNAAAIALAVKTQREIDEMSRDESDPEIYTKKGAAEDENG